MFSFFKKKPPPAPADPVPAAPVDLPAVAAAADSAPLSAPPQEATPATARQGWLSRLTQGLRKTGAGIAQVFTGTRIDDALYEELESALLLADTGVSAAEFLLVDLKRRVKEAKATEPSVCLLYTSPSPRD